MFLYPAEITKKTRLCLILAVFVISAALSTTAMALDLVPDIFKSSKINRNIWKQQEQYVALAPQSAKNARGIQKNQHPIILDLGEVRDALLSLELWVEGGFFRNEEAVPVLSSGQITTLVRYLVEGLAQAATNEDIVFNIRGYGNVALDIVREKFWTAGRIFYVNDKLNIIIGTYQVKKDRGIKQAEASFGVLDDYSDIHFYYGARDDVAKMPGRIITTAGVTLNAEAGRERPDWVQINIPVAAIAYRDSLIPDVEKKREARVKREAAKLTVERRKMREEMARLRKELDKMKSGGAQAPDLEQRLATLQDLKDKDLISDDEFRDRRKAILEEI
jgi:hypothetical protein